MIIMFVIPAMGRGGAERVVSILANSYAQRGQTVYIAMMVHNEVSYDLSEQIKILDLSNDRIPSKLDLPRMVFALHRALKKYCPEVIVSFMGQMTLVTGLAKWGIKARFIPSERIDPSQVHRVWPYKKLLEHFYRYADCVIMQTEKARDYFPDNIRSNCVIIPNPIAVSVESRKPARNRVVTAGRLTAQKNHKLLIDAFEIFRVGHEDYTLEIFGEGKLRNSLQAYIHSKGLDPCVMLMGNVSDLHLRISDASMFVLSSDFEGLSNALLEAMSMGLPCISTNCAGSEVIQDGESGFITPIGDCQSLANAMRRIADDEALSDKLRFGAKKQAALYSYENVIQQWDNVIMGKENDI